MPQNNRNPRHGLSKRNNLQPGTPFSGNVAAPINPFVGKSQPQEDFYKQMQQEIKNWAVDDEIQKNSQKAIADYNESQKYAATPNTIEEQLEGTLPKDIWKKYKDLKTEWEKINSVTYQQAVNDIKNYGQDFTRRQIEGTEDASWFHKAGAKTGAWLSDMFEIPVSLAAGLGTYATMGKYRGRTKEEKERSKQIEEQMTSIAKPALEEGKQYLVDQMKRVFESRGFKVDENGNVEGFIDVTSLGPNAELSPRITEYLRDHPDAYGLVPVWREYQKAIEYYDDAINGAVWSGFIREELGAIKMLNNLQKINLVNKVRNQGEESLTDFEKEQYMAFKAREDAQNGELNSKFWYKALQTTRLSAEMIGEMAGGMRGVKGMMSLARLGKFAKTSGGRAIQAIGSPLLQPMSLNTAADYYSSQVQVIELPDGSIELVATQEQKDKMIKEANEALTIVRSDKQQLLNKKNLSARDERILTKLELEEIILQEAIDKIVDPETGEYLVKEITGLQAGVRGTTETLKENVTEIFGGALIDKGFKLVGGTGRRFINNNIGAKGRRRLHNLNRKTEKLSAFGWKKAVDSYNFADKALAGRLGAKNINEFKALMQGQARNAKSPAILNSLPAEMLEEVLNELMPTYMEEFDAFNSELFNPEFYALTAASTALQGLGMSALGAVAHYNRYATDPAYRQAMANSQNQLLRMRALYQELDEAIGDDERLAETIIMGTGGNLYTTTAYRAKIRQLRDENSPDPDSKAGIAPRTMEQRIAAAKVLEDAMFTNIAIQAINTDTVSDFKNTLQNIADSEHSSDLTKEESQRAIRALNLLVTKTEQHKGKINENALTNLEYNKHLIESALEHIESQRIRREDVLMESLDDFNRERNLRGLPRLTIDDIREIQRTEYIAMVENKEEAAKTKSLLGEDISADVEELMGIMENNAMLRELVEQSNNKQAVSEYLDSLMNENQLRFSLRDVNNRLNFETDPANEEEIKNREGAKIKDYLLENVTTDNLDDTIDILERYELADEEILDTLKKTARERETKSLKRENKKKTTPTNTADKSEFDEEAVKEFAEASNTRAKRKLDAAKERSEQKRRERNLTEEDRAIMQLRDKADIFKVNESSEAIRLTDDQITYIHTIFNIYYSNTIASIEILPGENLIDAVKRVALDIRTTWGLQNVLKFNVLKFSDSGQYANTGRHITVLNKKGKRKKFFFGMDDGGEIFILTDLSLLQSIIYTGKDKKVGTKNVKAVLSEFLPEHTIDEILNNLTQQESSLSIEDMQIATTSNGYVQLTESNNFNKEELAREVKELRTLSNKKGRLTKEERQKKKLIEDTIKNTKQAIANFEEFEKVFYGRESKIRVTATPVIETPAEKPSEEVQENIEVNTKTQEAETQPENVNPENMPGANSLTPDQEENLRKLSEGDFSSYEVDEEDVSHQNYINFLKGSLSNLVPPGSGTPFRGLADSLYHSPHYGSTKLYSEFFFVVAAWNALKTERGELGQVSQKEAEEIFKNLYFAEKSIEVFGQEVAKVTGVVTQKEIDETHKAGELIIGAEINSIDGTKTDKNYAPHTNRLYAGNKGIKAGIPNAQAYEDTPEGKVTTNTAINEDAKPFMHWDNFKEGDSVDIVFDIDYMLDENSIMTVWKNPNAQNAKFGDAKPIPTKVTVMDRLVEMFKDDKRLNKDGKLRENIKKALEDYKQKRTPEGNPLFTKSDGSLNEEFLGIIPTAIVNNGIIKNNNADGTRPPAIISGGLHDVNWFNTGNIALQLDYAGKPNLIERALRIKTNQKANMEARRAMLSQAGRHAFTVESNRNATTNKRLLQTEREKETKELEEFFSVLDQFGGLENFNKSATLVYISDNAGTLVESKNDKGDIGPHITKDGKRVPIKTDQITNLDEFYRGARESGFFQGRTGLIYQTGVKLIGKDENGKPVYQPTYAIINVINNHAKKEKEFEKLGTMARKLFSEFIGDSVEDESLAITQPDKYAEREKLKRARAAKFKAVFGYALTQTVKDRIEAYYPTKFTTGEYAGKYRQDYAGRMFTQGITDKVPDLREFDTIEAFIDRLMDPNTTEMPMVDRKELVLSNLHTNYLFSEISDGETTIYTNTSQPVITFKALSTPNTQAGDNTITEEMSQVLARKARIQELLNNIQEQIDSAETNELTEKEKTELDKQKENLVRELEALGETLEEVTTETPKTKNIVVEKVVEREEKKKELTEEDVLEALDNNKKPFGGNADIDILNRVVREALVSLDFSQPVTRSIILNLARESYDKIAKQLREDGKVAEARYMEELRDFLLGEISYEGSIREYVDAMLETEEEVELFDTEIANIKEHGKSSYEQDFTKTLKYQIKLMLGSIVDTRKGTGFAGFAKSMPLYEAVDALHQILSDARDSSLEAVKEVVDARVERNPNELAFFHEIYERLENMKKNNPDYLAQTLYSLYQPGTRMRMIMWTTDKYGKIVGRNYDANAKNPQFVKSNLWTEKLKQSPVIEMYNGNMYRVNENELERLEALYDKIKSDHNKTASEGSEILGMVAVVQSELKDLLTSLGIHLNDQTIKNIYETGTQNDFQITRKLLIETNAAVPLILKNLRTVANNAGKVEYTFDLKAKKGTGERLNPLENNNTQLQDIIKADNYVEFHAESTMYIAGKPIYAYQQANAVTNKISDIVGELRQLIVAEKENGGNEVPLSETLQELQETMITSNSNLVKLLLRHKEEAVKYFDTFLISLEALKKSGAKSRDDLGITELSDRDAWVTLLTMYASSEGKMKDTILEGETDGMVTLRKGVVNFPTLSDASNLPFLKTFLYELTAGSVDTETGKIEEPVLKLLRDQLLVADLLRTAEYMVEAEDDRSIEGYHIGAKLVTGMTSLNMLALKNEEGNIRSLKELFERHINENREQLKESGNYERIVEAFVERHKEAINQEIEANIAEEVDKFITEDLQGGILAQVGLVNSDTKRLDLSDGKSDGFFENKTARLVMYDYVINNMLQQKDIHTIFAGDVAQYFQNKTEAKFENGLPKVSFTEFVLHNYGNQEDIGEISKIVGEENLSKVNPLSLSDQVKEKLIEDYPLFSLYIGLTTSENQQESDTMMLAVMQDKMSDIFRDAQNNLSKRLKELISPGHQYSNLRTQENYLQIMTADVVRPSQVLLNIIDNHYQGLSSREFKEGRDEKYKTNRDALLELQRLGRITEKTPEEIAEQERLIKEFKPLIPSIQGYLEMASTDAQEYTTWRENLKQMRTQGRISPVMYETIEKKLEAQSRDLEKEGGRIKEENLLTPEEISAAIMQTTKPLHSGMAVNTRLGENRGHRVRRHVYIKSSSFPLLPQLTQHLPQLNQLRKHAENIERLKQKPVRISYASANKVGAVGNPIQMQKLYNPGTSVDEIMISTVELSRANFFIQQDKPYKQDEYDEKGKAVRITRATQFEKIILGDGINKIKDKIFPTNIFDQALFEEDALKDIDIKDGKIDGPSLKRIYDYIYKREQKLLSEKLFRELGIDTFADVQQGNPKVMRKLAKLLRERVKQKQEKDALELLYEVAVDNKNIIMSEGEWRNSGLPAKRAFFRTPIFLTPNSRKFESVLSSLVSKNNINLSISGFASPVGSSEGFSFSRERYVPENLKKMVEDGLVLHPDFDPAKGLTGQVSDDGSGVLKYAQVFLPNKFRTYDISTGTYKEVDLTQYVDPDTNLLDTEKLPEDLMSMFSYRIPTSSHQSGTIIQVVGILPKSMGDLMIVPAEHTVQIGEDYDIDMRYVQQYSFLLNEHTGLLEKISRKHLSQAKAEKVENLVQLKKDIDVLEKEAWKIHQGKDIEETNTFDNRIRELAQRSFIIKTSLGRLLALRDKAAEKQERVVERIEDIESQLEDYDTSWMDSLDSEQTEGSQMFFSNYFKEEFNQDEFSIGALRTELEKLKNELVTLAKGREQRKALLAELESAENFFKDLYNSKKGEKIKQAWLKYGKALNAKDLELKILENDMLAMYKSVFSSTNSQVQNLITKELSTSLAENSAKVISDITQPKTGKFNLYSPMLQRDVMKRGSDGKIGIGVHSNALTMSAILQQLPEPLQFISHYDKNDNSVPYKIQLGQYVFDGIIGKDEMGIKGRISESLMESQNSSTDNQKLGIMGRRNETPETINVFSLLQVAGYDNIGFTVRDQEVSYASLFIAQPVIQEFVKRLKDTKSSTNSENYSIDAIAQELSKSLAKLVPEKYWAIDKMTGEVLVGTLSEFGKQELGEAISGQGLYDMLAPEGQFDIVDEEIAARQYYILRTFNQFRGMAKTLGDLQKFVNIENKGMGISYFDAINRKDQLLSLGKLDITSVSSMGSPVTDTSRLLMGDRFIATTEEETKTFDSDPDLVFVSEDNLGNRIYFRPEHHFAHKIVNATALGYNLWNHLFPYDHTTIKNQISTILLVSGIKEDEIFGSNSKRVLDAKYDIISTMKDYAYTKNTLLFGEDLVNMQSELFFEDGDRESLPRYLLRLSTMEEYKDLFTTPFFKDLRVVLGEGHFPSILEYNRTGKSPLEGLIINNLLDGMVNSDVVLPPKLHGAEMTEAQLMKELLAYSLIADQANGATGFRHVLPVSLLTKYGVDKELRARDVSTNKLNSSFAYRGVQKAAEDYFFSGINENGIIPASQNFSAGDKLFFVKSMNILTNREYGVDNAFSITDEGFVKYNYADGTEDSGTFVRQYFQHNPDKVRFGYREPHPKARKGNDFELLMESNGYTVDDYREGKVTSFTETIVPGTTPVAFKKIVTQGGEIHLYELESTRKGLDDTSARIEVANYKRITILGTNGFSEYEAGKTINESWVDGNSFKTWTASDYFMDESIFGQMKTDINPYDVINELFSERNSPYFHLMTLLKPYMGSLEGLTIEVREGLEGRGKYERDTNKILIAKEVLDNPRTTNKVVQDIFVEEILHHFTRTALSRYGAFTEFSAKGVEFISAPGMTRPAEIDALLAVYNDAIRYYVEKHGEEALMEAFENQKAINSSGKAGAVRMTPGKISGDIAKMQNIHEFLAGIFIQDSLFAREMGKVPYKNSKKSILAKFTEVLLRFLNKILPKAKSGSISTHAYSELFNFLNRDATDNIGKYKKLEIDPLSNREAYMRARAAVIKAESAAREAEKSIKALKIDTKHAINLNTENRIDGATVKFSQSVKGVNGIGFEITIKNHPKVKLAAFPVDGKFRVLIKDINTEEYKDFFANSSILIESDKLQAEIVNQMNMYLNDEDNIFRPHMIKTFGFDPDADISTGVEPTTDKQTSVTYKRKKYSVKGKDILLNDKKVTNLNKEDKLTIYALHRLNTGDAVEVQDSSGKSFIVNREGVIFSLDDKVIIGEDSKLPNIQKLRDDAKNILDNNTPEENDYSAYIAPLIDSGAITFTNDKGELCAEKGLRNTVTGTNWKIVKDFKGQPKHSQGGVDIEISDKGVTLHRGDSTIMAKYGLVIKNIEV